jgi:hypothetical protein
MQIIQNEAKEFRSESASEPMHACILKNFQNMDARSPDFISEVILYNRHLFGDFHSWSQFLPVPPESRNWNVKALRSRIRGEKKRTQGTIDIGGVSVGISE